MVQEAGAMVVPDSLVDSAEAFVREALSEHDASHDFFHIQRVRSNARALARKEQLSEEQVKLLDLAALLHDVADWKYTGQGGAGGELQKKSVEAFLKSQACPTEITTSMLSMISTVGFKDELPRKVGSDASGDPSTSIPELSIEAKILQDADRLDAIGAIGIARCLTFGGAFKRVLHDPSIPPRVGLTKAEYMASGEKNTTLNHFYEKLLLLKDMMKTDAGRSLAEERHSFMLQFLEQFQEEWEGKR